ncbi:7-cyano-7-deazaguanine synthase QueC [Ruficoccus amylovorans]|uniref:7-cyano-7-deazaguanine synthase n=1 Tax=Ruficoccus amylovorans TaxID=1804625 RepID=A0A842HD16_9BACT|nr:7-cyano-7-deazaguanine synthase QueC [Ruficoccus amylovorans]MBC2593271.1 7-cyano-7-deazaguanine synthase QueC [Ruficoccus amylovorans]
MNAIVVYSGGLDSTVLLYELLKNGHEVAALSVNYGQRHDKEITCAAALCQLLGIEHRVADLSGVVSLLGGSSLTDPAIAVPEGHYAEESMKQTVVPNRNMILLSLAAGWAISRKADCVAYAAHAGDHAIYPDCREEFTDALDKTIRMADWHEVFVHRPYVQMTKAGIVARGAELGVPFEKTWSCYQGGDKHCGRCGTCIERREAFHLAGVEDPTPYADNAPALADLIANDWNLPPC